MRTPQGLTVRGSPIPMRGRKISRRMGAWHRCSSASPRSLLPLFLACGLSVTLARLLSLLYSHISLFPYAAVNLHNVSVNPSIDTCLLFAFIIIQAFYISSELLFDYHTFSSQSSSPNKLIIIPVLCVKTVDDDAVFQKNLFHKRA